MARFKRDKRYCAHRHSGAYDERDEYFEVHGRSLGLARAASIPIRKREPIQKSEAATTFWGKNGLSLCLHCGQIPIIGSVLSPTRVSDAIRQQKADIPREMSAI